MEPKLYIIEALENFVKLFKKARVRYEHDEIASVHTIEVLPNQFYHLDKDYIEWEKDFYHCFVDKYPSESICFVSDDAIVGIERTDYISIGLEYDSFSMVKESHQSFTTPNIKIYSLTEQLNTFFENPQFSECDEKLESHENFALAA